MISVVSSVVARSASVVDRSAIQRLYRMEACSVKQRNNHLKTASFKPHYIRLDDCSAKLCKSRKVKNDARRPWIAERSTTLVAFLLMLCCLLPACNRPTRLPMMQAIQGRTMGTTYSIKLFSNDASADLLQTSQAIEQELEQVNAQMSTYLTTSELSRFNAQESEAWFPVSKETAEVVSLSLQLSELTDGAFDVTVGPLVDLWGFGPTTGQPPIPSQSAITQALQAVGADKLAVRLEPPALRKNHPQLRVDLSAIAKGHAVDRLAKVLDRLKFDAYFVEIGGEVRTKGHKLDETQWQVGIERPTVDQQSVQRALALSDLSLATSGNYRNFHEVDGRRYSHTINPETGRPVEDPIASASVIATNCALADGIATGMMSAGFDAGMALAERNGWSVLLVRPTADGDFETAMSAAFAKSYPE